MKQLCHVLILIITVSSCSKINQESSREYQIALDLYRDMAYKEAIVVLSLLIDDSND